MPDTSTVTILFTDVVGSTALTQRLGDAKAQEVLIGIHNAIVRDTLRLHSGSEVKHTGDGIMASFASATSALRCAIAMQEAFALHNETSEEHIGVRIGLNAGEPITEEEDLFGTAVQLAARICDQAESGEILVSNVMRELTAGKGFEFAGRRELVLKGFQNPVTLYQAVWQQGEEKPADIKRPAQTKTPGTATPLSSRRQKLVTLAALVAVLIGLCAAGLLLFRSSEIEEPIGTETSAGTSRQMPPEGSPVSIAVLPFANMTPDKDLEYFCDGLAEEIINSLAQLNNLRVIARTSAFSFKGRGMKISDIGRELNVESVLDGSVRKEGNKLRITVHLVDVSDNYELLTERYDTEMESVFAIQDAISLAIVDRLKPGLQAGEMERLTRRRTADIEAFDLYLRGRWFWNKRSAEGLKKAVEYFEQAIEKDPNYALPYIGLADYYVVLPQYVALPPKMAFPKAKQAALKALQIDDSIGEAHASLGYIKMLYDWDWAGAEQEHRRAIELSPGYAPAHLWYGFYLMVTKQFPEAIREMLKAQELDPFSIVIRRSVGVALRSAGQTDEAIDSLEETIEMAPEFPYAHSSLGFAYLDKSMYEEALAEFQKEKELSGMWNPFTETLIGVVYAKLKRTDETRKVLEEFLERSKKEYVPASHVALLYLALEENDRAYEWLNKAIQDRDFWLIWIRADATFSDVFSTPRFQALFEKMGPES